ncbi:MAG: hypothetical protein ABEJ27_05705 [Halodesulfurarchaeum sp.]
MANGSSGLRRVIAGVTNLVRRTVFVNLESEPADPFPTTEQTYVLDRGVLGGGEDRYTAVAGEVTRAVVDVSPRPVVAIDLHSATIETPDGMDRLAASTDLPADGTPDGRVIADDKTVDAVARLLGPALQSATFVDAEEQPVLEWRDRTELAFGLPQDAFDRLTERLPAPVIEACRAGPSSD